MVLRGLKYYFFEFLVFQNHARLCGLRMVEPHRERNTKYSVVSVSQRTGLGTCMVAHHKKMGARKM